MSLPERRAASDPERPLRVLITGDRDWTDRYVIECALWMLPNASVILHGACRGADTIAAEVALENGFVVEAYPADWTVHGRAAGPLRNATMLKEGKPDAVYVFHDDLEESLGTADMVRRATGAGVPVTIFRSGT